MPRHHFAGALAQALYPSLQLMPMLSENFQSGSTRREKRNSLKALEQSLNSFDKNRVLVCFGGEDCGESS